MLLLYPEHTSRRDTKTTHRDINPVRSPSVKKRSQVQRQQHHEEQKADKHK